MREGFPGYDAEADIGEDTRLDYNRSPVTMQWTCTMYYVVFSLLKKKATIYLYAASGLGRPHPYLPMD